MIEPRDEELSRIYRDAEGPQPPQRVDDNIIAASRRVAGAKPRSARAGFVRRWSAPVALAATVVVTSTLTLVEFDRQSDPDTTTSAASSDDRPSRSRSARQKATAPATPTPQARRDREEPRAGEGTASNERLATGQPAFAADVPRAPAGADQPAPSPDAQRAPEVLRQVPRAPATPLAADANTLRESALTLQRAGVMSAPAGRVAVSEARERTPEKWLEDIRKLKTQAKTAEAERELAEFRKRYPDYRLPEDLR